VFQNEYVDLKWTNYIMMSFIFGIPRDRLVGGACDMYMREVLSKFCSINVKESGLLENPGTDGRILLK
jgi:hypothetical protein